MDHAMQQNVKRRGYSSMFWRWFLNCEDYCTIYFFFIVQKLHKMEAIINNDSILHCTIVYKVSMCINVLLCSYSFEELETFFKHPPFAEVYLFTRLAPCVGLNCPIDTR